MPEPERKAGACWPRPAAGAAIAGDAPDARPKKGRLFGAWEARAPKAEEDQKLKMAAWDKVLQKRQQQKRLAAEPACLAKTCFDLYFLVKRHHQMLPNAVFSASAELHVLGFPIMLRCRLLRKFAGER